MKVGIARSFVYYASEIDWESFFEILGHEVIFSLQSKEGLLDLGQHYCNNDDCLPLKHYFGHIIDLSKRADNIFVPQLVSLKRGGNCCPKVIAIPLLVKNGVSHLDNILSAEIDANHPVQTRISVAKLAMRMSNDPRKIFKAIEHVMKAPKQRIEGESRPAEGKALGLLGHAYSIQDRSLNLDLLERIRRNGYRVVTPSPAIDRVVSHATHGSAFGCREVHWDCGQRLINTAGYYLGDDSIAGVINLTFFGCGIDAFVEEVYKKHLSDRKPYLTLTFDEHSGEAGLVTRLEAFLDMMARRN